MPPKTRQSIAPPPPAPLNASVNAVILAFQQQFEGNTNYLYQDGEGNVTIGIGNNLTSSPADFSALAFVNRNTGAPATPLEKAQLWSAISNPVDANGSPISIRSNLAAAQAITDLRATPSTLAALEANVLVRNVTGVTSVFPNFSLLPADAQLAILSMAWAGGAAFAAGGRYPKLREAVATSNWEAAAAASGMGNAGE